MTDRRRTDPLTGEVIEDPPIRVTANLRYRIDHGNLLIGFKLPDTRTVYVCIPSEPGHQLGALPLFDNETYEVERPEPPDPDAELVEVMAEAIRADDNASDGWHETTDSIRADYRSNARAALAAARKAGLL